MDKKVIFRRIIAAMVGFLFFAYLTSLTTRLLSAKSDFAVAIGALLGIGIAAGCVWVALTWLPSIWKALGLALLAPVLLTQQGCGSCSYETIEPGYVGIRLNLYGEQKGMEKLPVETGRIWYSAWSERIYVFRDGTVPQITGGSVPLITMPFPAPKATAAVVPESQ